jgi:uncharacterized membrane protein
MRRVSDAAGGSTVESAPLWRSRLALVLSLGGLGIATYLTIAHFGHVAMTALNLPVAWRSTDRRVHIARLALLVLGMCFALYLVSAELLIIGAICLWCTGVHLVTFCLFVLVVQTVPRMLGWGQRG